MLVVPPPSVRKQIDCLEIYLPKSLEFLSELYRFLREKVTTRLGHVVLDGFSIYEVDGFFRGESLWEQRTLIIRILFVKPEVTAQLEAVIQELGREIASQVAVREEQIWICSYPQQLRVFAGLKRLFPQEGHRESRDI
jgi:hypothetical protein